MLFNIQRDQGDLIEGYVIPDGFSDIPIVVVADEDGQIAEVVCDQPHIAVRESGRHETGLVGFRLTEANVPRLISRKTLFLREIKSGLLIYRRPLQPDQINMKVIRLELQLLPQLALDREMVRHFQYALPLIERFGHETTLQAFLLHGIPSIYLSGRLQVRSFQDFLDKGFRGVVLLNDPYYDMASRIIALKRFATIKPSFLGKRDFMTLAPAIEYFGDLDLNDTAALSRSLKKAPPRVGNVLYSPMTRQFACADFDQRSTRRDIATAMDLVSRFDVIGHMNNISSFASSVGELLGLDMNLVPIAPRYFAFDQVAERLKTLPIAETYLEDDLILDYYIRQAMEADESDANQS